MRGVRRWASRRRPVRVFRGFAARPELFTAGHLNDAAVLHVAAHAAAEGSPQGGADLVLSQLDVAGRPRNGVLSAREVAGLDLAADLVVLAACRSAAEGAGAGPAADSFGLAEAFLRGGARRVVGSLWPVDDASTAELMVDFHEALWQRRMPPAAALRQVQSRAAEAGRPADEWAAFVLLGDWRGETP